MDHKQECAVMMILRQVRSRLEEEAEYDYAAKEIVHKIDRVVAGRPPQKNGNQIKADLNAGIFARSQ